jgi:hypothetical protein
MKIENDKIIQATEDELYSYWLSRGWDDVYSFHEYMQRMKDAGCEVIAEILPTLFDRITESPEVLAPYFVEKQPDQWGDDDYAYYSYLTKEWYATEDKAIAATVAKLKEVCDE